MTEKESLAVLKDKLKHLKQEDTDQLQDILLGEDLDDLLENGSTIEMFLSELGPQERGELCQKVFAFMDTHPVELGEKPQSSNSEILPVDPEAAD